MSAETTVRLDAALVAQPRALHMIDALVDAKRVHAVLLTGDPENGPLAAAARIAERVICPSGGGDGCDVCLRVARGVHPDVARVTSEGGSLAIDQVREVLEVVSRMPFEAAAQVVIIEDADTLSSDNAAAGNSLLKALEEPAGRVVFVLVARRPARMLPTIRSRVIEVVFPSVSHAGIVAALVAEGVDEGQLAARTGLGIEAVARLARGDVQRARELADGGPAAVRRGVLLPALEAVVGGAAQPQVLAAAMLDRATAVSDAAAAAATEEFARVLERMSVAEQRSFQSKSNDQGIEKRTARRARRARIAELRACLEEVAVWWRDVLVVHSGAGETVVNVDRLERLTSAATGPAGARAVPALDAIDEAETRLLFNNADEPVTIAALAAELAALAGGRVRARRTIGAPARTATGYDLALG
ncbi:MAG: polymerase subunit delta [Thermoleophilia bacterium]|nr:polymerase subunit delta [Thermoleophilia bacterium]